MKALDTPDKIGPYRILGPLGEGGMGVVYLAEQTKPIHRRVALKIIKLGMDTKQVIARFEAEREALALMNHPNVAKVFDAGTTDLGRPYFVMEHVPGIPITDYCDKHRLTTAERLRLYIDVCNAVQHAHQKGIIHRDLKPSNVLVAVQDEKPVCKVIDFGVAKATQHRLTEQTLFTEQGQLIGTPGYMSPEQAEMTALDVDTRTDIYSLGVMLYELLAGALPFENKALLQGGLLEIQRIIREVEPAKPSTRLSSMGAKSATIAHKRNTEARTLVRQLRGELDWIAMKALEKDRTRRYDTASALASEIQRFLSNEPVLAGPPGAGYRLRKFVRRNRTAVSLVSAIFLLVLWFANFALRQAMTAIEQEKRAFRAERSADSERGKATDALAGLRAFSHLLGSGGIESWLPPGGLSDRWKAIVVHSITASDRALGIDTIDELHRQEGFDEIVYHFVIAEDPLSEDGLIAATSRWLKQKHGMHCNTTDNYYNDHAIGICLIGNFGSQMPSPAQLSALEGLTTWLVRTCGIEPRNVLAHKEIVGASACPGELLSVEALRTSLLHDK